MKIMKLFGHLINLSLLFFDSFFVFLMKKYCGTKTEIVPSY